MNNPKLKKQPTPEELYHAATEGQDLPDGALRLLASGLVALQEAYRTPVNQVELNAIKSMIAYVSYKQRVAEETVTSILLATFDVEEVEFLPTKRYQDIIEYLVDLEMNKVVN